MWNLDKRQHESRRGIIREVKMHQREGKETVGEDNM
jgi:hypothetical protein